MTATRILGMEINIPDIVAEVGEAFMRYERALCTNDLATLAGLFWKSPATLRYGPNGTLLGHDAITGFRRGRENPRIERTLKNTYITTFGRDFAVANTESERPGSSRVFRQSQTWVRTGDGWQIVSAHVSDVEAPPKC